jgi:hypothetical protein
MNTQNMNTQQQQNMMAMMNNFMKSQQNMQQIFDPKKLDPRSKRTLINQTIAQTKIGLYKAFPKFKSISCQFTSNFNPGVPNNICEVDVVYDHILDVAELYAEKGINYTQTNNMNPVIINVVGREFSGSNLETCENIRDEIVNIRTTFSNTIGSNPPYPMNEEECVYSRVVTIIRPKQPIQWLAYPQTYRTAMITVAPIKIEKLLSDNKMSCMDFGKTCTVIECIFQAALAKGHPILILPPFGHEDDNNPIDDIIKVYNYCIFKYGHLFKKIIIGVPPHYPQSVFKAYQKDIIKPQDIVTIVDKQFEQEEMKKSLMEKSQVLQIEKKTKNDEPLLNNTQLHKNDSQLLQNPVNNFSKEQMETFMKMFAMMQQQ